MSIYLKNILRAVLLILIQVYLLNNITLRWWSQPLGFPVFVPFIYPLIILLLPFETPVWLLIIIGFITGISVDTFMNTSGMHAFATVLIAYLRTNVLQALLTKRINDYPNQSPNVKVMGWKEFMIYASFLFAIHALVFFIIELWSFSHPIYLLLKIIASVLTSLFFVVIYLLLFTGDVKESY